MDVKVVYIYISYIYIYIYGRYGCIGSTVAVSRRGCWTSADIRGRLDYCNRLLPEERTYPRRRHRCRRRRCRRPSTTKHRRTSAVAPSLTAAARSSVEVPAKTRSSRHRFRAGRYFVGASSPTPPPTTVRREICRRLRRHHRSCDVDRSHPGSAGRGRR